MGFVARIDAPVATLTGPDARRFCNGMFSNNARDLPVGAGQRTAMLDDRGRVLGLLDLYCAAEDRFVAVLEGTTVDAFAERYGMYVVLDDVEIAAAPDLAVLSVQGGPGPEAVPAPLLWCPHPRSVAGGYDVVGPTDAVHAWESTLALERVDAARLRVARVRAVLPRWPDDFGERSLPHELGLRDAFLSFDKGCYVGQETVNRVDVMGQVRRRLVRLRLDGEAPAGAAISVGGAAIGTLTSPVDDPELGWIGLGVLRMPHDQPGTRVDLAWEGGGTQGTVEAPT